MRPQQQRVVHRAQIAGSQHQTGQTDAGRLSFAPQLQQRGQQGMADQQCRTGLCGELVELCRELRQGWPDMSPECVKAVICIPDRTILQTTVVIRITDERLERHPELGRMAGHIRRTEATHAMPTRLQRSGQRQKGKNVTRSAAAGYDAFHAFSFRWLDRDVWTFRSDSAAGEAGLACGKNASGS